MCAHAGPNPKKNRGYFNSEIKFEKQIYLIELVQNSTSAHPDVFDRNDKSTTFLYEFSI